MRFDHASWLEFNIGVSEAGDEGKVYSFQITS